LWRFWDYKFEGWQADKGMRLDHLLLWIREFHAIGPEMVRFRVPNQRRVIRGELLRSETVLPLKIEASTVAFTIPQIVDYEIATLYCA
jgi:hypothetical protein